MGSRIIIGIHGLGNKPPAQILKTWWCKAINEGLRRIQHPGVFFRFELVYWADIFHPTPLNVQETDPKSSHYIEFPYTTATEFSEKSPSKWRRKVLDFLERQMDHIFFNKDKSPPFQSVTNLIIRHYFKDLDLYYTATVKAENDQEVAARDVIKQRLSGTLRKFRDKDILLIAHSMGSIIAYEVLCSLASELSVDTLITIGSPLGQPLVMSKFLTEFFPKHENASKPVTPENIRKNWFNLSDLGDHVAMNYNLADDYEMNTAGLGPQDQVVFNNYVYQNKRNPHKSYGYLRTPEFANIIYQFLSRDRSKLGFWFSNRYLELTQKLFGDKR